MKRKTLNNNDQKQVADQQFSLEWFCADALSCRLTGSAYCYLRISILGNDFSRHYITFFPMLRRWAVVVKLLFLSPGILDQTADKLSYVRCGLSRDQKRKTKTFVYYWGYGAIKITVAPSFHRQWPQGAGLRCTSLLRDKNESKNTLESFRKILKWREPLRDTDDSVILKNRFFFITLNICKLIGNDSFINFGQWTAYVCGNSSYKFVKSVFNCYFPFGYP